jgi:hypothetical protein
MFVSVSFKTMTQTYSSVLEAIVSICKEILNNNSIITQFVLVINPSSIYIEPYEQEMNTWILNFIKTEQQYKFLNQLDKNCGYPSNEGLTFKDFLAQFNVKYFASKISKKSTPIEIIDLYDSIIL